MTTLLDALSAEAAAWARAYHIGVSETDPTLWREALMAAGKPIWPTLLQAVSTVWGATTSLLSGLPPVQVAERRSWLEVGPNVQAAPFARSDLGEGLGMRTVYIDARGTIWSTRGHDAVRVADSLTKLVEMLAVATAMLEAEAGRCALYLAQALGPAVAAAIGAVEHPPACGADGAFWVTDGALVFDSAPLFSNDLPPFTALWTTSPALAARAVEAVAALRATPLRWMLPEGESVVRQAGEAPALEQLLAGSTSVRYEPRGEPSSTEILLRPDDEPRVEAVAVLAGAVTAHRAWSAQGARATHYDSALEPLQQALSNRAAAAFAAVGARRDLSRTRSTSALRERLRQLGLPEWEAVLELERQIGGLLIDDDVWGVWSGLSGRDAASLVRGRWVDCVPVTRGWRRRRSSGHALDATGRLLFVDGDIDALVPVASGWRPHLERRALRLFDKHSRGGTAFVHALVGASVARCLGLPLDPASSDDIMTTWCHESGVGTLVQETRVTLRDYHWSPHTRVRCASADELLDALLASKREWPEVAVELWAASAEPRSADTAEVLRVRRWDSAGQRVSGSWVFHRDSSGAVGFEIDPE